VVDSQTRKIYSTRGDKGRSHDFKIYKESKLHTNAQKQADTAYKSKAYPQIITPHKKARKSKQNPDPKLTPEQKQENRRLGKIRITVEHVIRELKVFRIVSERYRNRRKRFGLRMNLIAGLYNFEIKHV
jgi:hypothetical protein